MSRCLELNTKGLSEQLSVELENAAYSNDGEMLASVKVGENSLSLKLTWVDQNRAELSLTQSGMRTSQLIYAAENDEHIFIHFAGQHWRIKRDALSDDHHVQDDTVSAVIAPMPGTVVELLVAEGQSVVKNQTLIMIESMKLQTELCASFDGTVTRAPFATGETFDRGVALIRLDKKHAIESEGLDR